ncbi:TRAP-type C4-dicarboxylate transport system permease small subunit [Virgibacillus natechei]|uniref:TRAP-type C4-dicarboxylate transport system permease small subunit n=1 Tax=Virgibacillus natechei TaxID=1216297 RepID=A0ABS4IJY4_9BACI|nr:TRAP transporter small permease [Virgibacillus natechei]MBP1971236.1 TRAP-type C4-dicarboxylate transport system permease small subunit [Virgibacillus natechei]UZD12133.1 TRAP transporter small permease [Virgibacillus natechei]
MLQKMINVTERVVTPLNFVSGKFASLLLFGMMILTFSDVAGRFLVRPIQGTHELTYLGLAVMVFLSLGYTQQKKGHISVGVIIDNLPARGQAIINVLSYLLMLIILTLMLWQTYEYAIRGMNTVTGDLELPVYIFVLICVVGILIFLLTVLLDLLKSLQKVVKQDES